MVICIRGAVQGVKGGRGGNLKKSRLKSARKIPAMDWENMGGEGRPQVRIGGEKKAKRVSYTTIIEVGIGSQGAAEGRENTRPS